MMTNVPTVTVREGMSHMQELPAEPAPVPTLKLDMLAAVFIVTVAPSAIVTLSLAVGTTPPTHVAVALQFPPLAVEEILAAVALPIPNSVLTAATKRALVSANGR